MGGTSGVLEGVEGGGLLLLWLVEGLTEGLEVDGAGELFS